MEDLIASPAARRSQVRRERDEARRWNERVGAFLLALRVLVGKPAKPGKGHDIDACLVLEHEIKRIQAERDALRAEVEAWRKADSAGWTLGDWSEARRLREANEGERRG
jgi:hypothetical protein